MKLILLLIILIPEMVFADGPTLGFTEFSRFLCQKFEMSKNNPLYYTARAGWTDEQIQNINQQYGFITPGIIHKHKKRINGKTGFSYIQIANTPEGDGRNYLVNQTMSMMGILATGLLSTSGTVQAPLAAADLEGQAEQLQSVASTLASQGDTTNAQILQTAATNLTTESQALESGDLPGATTAANAVAAVQPQYVSSSYVPPAQSSAFVQSLQSVGGGIVTTTVGLVSTSLASQLFSSMGLASVLGASGGTAAAAMVGSAVAGIASGAISPGQALSNAGEMSLFTATAAGQSKANAAISSGATQTNNTVVGNNLPVGGVPGVTQSTVNINPGQAPIASGANATANSSGVAPSVSQ